MTQENNDHSQFFNFLNGGITKEILIWNDKKNNLTLCTPHKNHLVNKLNAENSSSNESAAIEIKLLECYKKSTTSLRLPFNTGHIFQWRLHNGSKEFKKSISLKYDTTLVNFDKFYHKLVIKK